MRALREQYHDPARGLDRLTSSEMGRRGRVSAHNLIPSRVPQPWSVSYMDRLHQGTFELREAEAENTKSSMSRAGLALSFGQVQHRHNTPPLESQILAGWHVCPGDGILRGGHLWELLQTNTTTSSPSSRTSRPFDEKGSSRRSGVV